MKTALICGVSGQDGAYLAQLLLRQGYRVFGSSRDAQSSPFANLRRLGIYDDVQLESVTLNDFRSVLQALHKIEPDEIYNLAGQSSVGLSFSQPVETMESISLGTLNLLEAIRFTNRAIRFYNAGSSECFGDVTGAAATETTPFRPRSPYAVAKAAAYWQVANYRDAYGLHACCGLLFNHESPLRPQRFVTRKIISGVVAIAQGKQKELSLGALGIRRDWGWAPEYVTAMWKMLQLATPEDFVVATGQTWSLGEFVETAFALVGLDARQHVKVDETLLRPTDIRVSRGDPAKAKKVLGWEAQYGMKEVVRMMIDAEDEGA